MDRSAMMARPSYHQISLCSASARAMGFQPNSGFMSLAVSGMVLSRSQTAARSK